MRRRWVFVGLLVLSVVFIFGWTLALWDLFETILAAGDTPYRLHHGYYGLAALIAAWVGLLCLFFMGRREHRHGDPA